MMLNILDFIRDTDYEVYQRTKYKIIEISPALADLQTKNLMDTLNAKGHRDRVEIINRSIFDWDTYVHSPCFFLALEVFDNFAHDTVRYNTRTELPQQGGVLIDADGEFHEYYNTQLDPVAARFLRVRQAASRRPFPSPLGPWYLRGIRSAPPFRKEFSLPEYIPTRLMQFFDVLNQYFPAHRLVASDFNSLPDAVPGLNAPVVQTRYQRRTVPVTTPFVSLLDIGTSLFRAKLIVYSTGSPGLLRHLLPNRLQRRRGRVPCRHWKIDSGHEPRGLCRPLGLCRRYRDAEWGEPVIDMVQKC